LTTKQPRRKAKAKTGSCHRCSGLCCRYFALPIETPTNWKDFDDMRWYLAHENISIFVEKGDWYLNVHNRCQYLAADHRCAIYETRPKICRTYKTDDCDFTGDDYQYQMHFTSEEQLTKYMKIKYGEKVLDRLKGRAKPKRKARSA
jgi:uncharacterized protein